MAQSYRWFADESVLGFGKRLSELRCDVLHPGHRDLPEVPLGAPDTEWMAAVAARGLIAFHRDRRIRTRPMELMRYVDHGLCSIWFGGKKDMSVDQQVSLAQRYWSDIEARVLELGQGPWSLTLTTRGLNELPWRPIG